MGRGLNCGEGSRKPRTLTVVSWVPSRRRLTGHKEERAAPAMQASTHGFSAGTGPALALNPGLPH